jgi:hypothetical protein
MLDLLLPKPGEGIGSEIAVGKLYASILIQDCFRRYKHDPDLTQALSLSIIFQPQLRGQKLKILSSAFSAHQLPALAFGSGILPVLTSWRS